MRKRVFNYVLLAATLIGLPMLCAWLGHRHDLLEGLLAFPPRTEDWGLDPAKLWNMRRPFSWPVFVCMAGGVLAAIAPFAWRLVRGGEERRTSNAERSTLNVQRSTPNAERRALPWFGWFGLALGTVAWVFAWNRFTWFSPLQAHTFLPLWIAYILVMNALCVRRSGRCLMTSHPGAYALLLPVSAAFWWFFEYLNRYVWNWYYRGVGEMNAAEYAFFATCCFATVLPAVTATAEWLATFRPFADGRLCGFARFDAHRSSARLGLIAVAAVGLTGIVFCPHLTFPLLWISPLAVFLSIQVVKG